jgi:hypothetical protein
VTVTAAGQVAFSFPHIVTVPVEPIERVKGTIVLFMRHLEFAEVMDFAAPVRAVIPGTQGRILEVLAETTTELTVHAAEPDSGADLIVDVDDTTVLVYVKAVALATPQRATDVASARRACDQAVPVLVADAIAAVLPPRRSSRLRDGDGWAPRTHLVLRGRGLLLDTTVSALQRPERIAPNPLAGPAAKSYAAALLLTPEAPPSMRDVARRSGMSSATVGEAAQRLRAAALLSDDGRPLYPELFWELAGAWSEYQPVPLQHLPRQADLVSPLELQGEPSEPHKMGPALSGTAAALAYDAPLASPATCLPTSI